MQSAPSVVVMGVCGAGKSTVGRSLASALGLRYVEGDELHPPENVARMAAGTPLTDTDRHGWLQAVAAELAAGPGRRPGVVVACSALKRSYRDLLRDAAPAMRLVHLHGERSLLERRLAARTGHYMPPTLLQSQLDTLEPPQADEQALVLDIAQPVEQLVGRACQWIRKDDQR